ncbi:Glycine receptor subunit beta-type 4 [Toxocara canis]|uniref:Glycine receptor subunit beta-type 4 n=1 Tax=Toxocara canis TaxID=6265 RepID=A0A0B2VWP2_TOXCA|nr:Glycine receptor subunit beta-type 4 [Toxocara canis]
MLRLWIAAYLLNSSFLPTTNCEHRIGDITAILKHKPEYNRNAHPTEGTDAYDINHLVIKWNTASPIETNEEIRMPDMRLKEILPGLRNSTYATGVWSCATAEFFVNREIMHHILQSYLPTALIVVISWFNFWLDVEAVPGRVSLSITTLLTLATQSSAARIALPQASYVKAIDVWMGACMTFVFSAMIEFTVVNFCVRHKPKRSRLIKTGKINISNRMQQLVAGYKQGTHTFIYKVC